MGVHAKVLLLVIQIAFTTAEVVAGGSEDAERKSEPEYRISPGFMLPTEYLVGSSDGKPQNLLPVEIASSLGDPELEQKENPQVKTSPEAGEPHVASKGQGNLSDVTLALIPDSSDLEFRHEISNYTAETPVPNFTAQIFTLSYAGVKKPVLIVQPDVKRAKRPTLGEGGIEGKSPGPQQVTSIPNFSIHFPLQTNSQFQIPRFNFTLPTLFLPGLVFTQNENVGKNTHELHVSIPHSDPSEYEQFPSSHIPSEFELIPHFISADDLDGKQEGTPEITSNGTDSKVEDPPQEDVGFADSRLRDNVTEVSSAKSNVTNNSPLKDKVTEVSPVQTSSLVKDRVTEATLVKSTATNSSSVKENATLIDSAKDQSIPAPIIQKVVITSSSTTDDWKNPSRAGKPIEAKLEHIKEKVANMTSMSNGGLPLSASSRPLHNLLHPNGNNNIPTPLLDHLTGSHLPSFPNPMLAHLRPNHTLPSKWKLPSLDQIYNRWFGAGRMDHAECGGARTDFEEEDEQDDPTLCGSEGLCGVTCNRLGFYAGKCVDSSSCVCLLKQRPEFGLKLEYFIDQRARSSEYLYPAFGFCHNSACRVNCEIAGYVTGMCDTTCFCGMPWAEKMSHI
ncbi:unnamed protein product [Allacma fusca]|uniref:Uncharacterized protein n=1 Tax=Allacma fusca TaxID=39272 RepID=A0A8J2PIY4_9HEXA|nr:unnamed protein product [Allacma fusca]